MKLSETIKQKIIKESDDWVENYAGNDKKKRQEYGQYFTPGQLVIECIERFDNVDGNILDPTVGGGAMLAGMIIAGADPKKCYGIELDENVLKIAQDRLSKLGVPLDNLHQGDALESSCYEWPKKGEKYVYNKETHKATIIKSDGKVKFRFGMTN